MNSNSLRAFNAPLRSCVALACFITTACNPQKTSDAGDLILCTDPRPEMCAQVYQPVCATRDPRLESDWKTYSNACVACADPAAQGYRDDACETR